METDTEYLLSMKQEVKDKWVEALESGDYTQGRSALHVVRTSDSEPDSELFCCLGVLSHLAFLAGAVTAGPSGRRYAAPGAVAYGLGRSTGYLPSEVIEWAGLRWHGENYNGYTSLADDEDEPTRCLRFGHGLKDTLSMRNDSGDSFEQIAGLIRTRIKGV